MTQPTSPTDIANIAIDFIGDRYITSIEIPETDRAEIMGRHYDLVRQQTLREFIWPFARKTTILARSGDGNITYPDSYLMPIDLLRLLSVGSWGGPGFGPGVGCYEIEGRAINTNNGGSNMLKIQYIRDEQAVGLFDPCFINILAYRLALNVAQRFTLQKTATKTLQERLTTELKKAVSICGQENPPHKFVRSPALEAKLGYRIGNYSASPWLFP